MGYNVLDVCRHVINYSNEQNYGISNLKLQKILYFIHNQMLLVNAVNMIVTHTLILYHISSIFSN